METYFVIKYKYEMGVYSLEKMCELVDLKWINENDFHDITGYNYKAIKNRE